MKLEVGMYVRTRFNTIRKIVKDLGIDEGYKNMKHFETDKFNKTINICSVYLYEEDIIGEPSFNPIDLIEVGDYVNGYKIVKVFKNSFNGKKVLIAMERQEEYEYSDNFKDYMCDDSIHIYNEDIETIVTKEQMKAMEYKID